MKQEVTPMDRIDYSTSERVVGTWIDGKPLYQKTVKPNLPTTITNGSATSIATTFADLGISNPNIGFIVNGFLRNKASGECVNNINIAWQRAGESYTYYVYVAFIPSTGIVVNTNRGIFKASDYDLYATVQYTKTTD